jgi:hypothetical protein
MEKRQSRAKACPARGLPNASSGDGSDADQAVQDEVRNAARTLLEGVKAKRSGRWVTAGETLTQPRQK